MAKSTIPAELACGALVQLRLIMDEDKGSVWEATCLRRLIFFDEHGMDGVHLPPGSVFYIPVGQIQGAYQTAFGLAGSVGNELTATHPIGAIVDGMGKLAEIDLERELPF